MVKRMVKQSTEERSKWMLKTNPNIGILDHYLINGLSKILPISDFLKLLFSVYHVQRLSILTT